jgi:hypothetical protein
VFLGSEGLASRACRLPRPARRPDGSRNGGRYDLILDLAAHRSVLVYRGSLVPGGRYLYVGGSAATLVQVLLLGPLLGGAEGKRVAIIE